MDGEGRSECQSAHGHAEKWGKGMDWIPSLCAAAVGLDYRLDFGLSAGLVSINVKKVDGAKMPDTKSVRIG